MTSKKSKFLPINVQDKSEHINTILKTKWLKLFQQLLLSDIIEKSVGNEDPYRYYFPMLRDAAFTLSRPGADKKQIGMHEAYFKTLEVLDEFNYTGSNRANFCNMISLKSAAFLLNCGNTQVSYDRRLQNNYIMWQYPV